MVLTNVQKGNRHKIASIQADGIILGKLAAFGIVPGAEIDVLNGSLHGSAIVICKGTQLALGRGLAELIYVKD